MGRTILAKKREFCLHCLKKAQKILTKYTYMKMYQVRKAFLFFLTTVCKPRRDKYLTLWHSDCPVCGIHFQSTRSVCKLLPAPMRQLSFHSARDLNTSSTKPHLLTGIFLQLPGYFFVICN